MSIEFTQLNDSPPAPRRGFNPGSVLLLIGVLAVVVVVGIQFFRQTSTGVGEGLIAPDFTVETFEGETFTLSEQRGSVVVVNFWGSWCPPCRDEAPALQSVYEQYRDRGVQMVGVSFNDLPANSQAFIDEFGLTYPNGLDTGFRITDRYGVQAAPETLVIDPEGRITRYFQGPITAEALTEALNAALGGA